MFNIASEKPLDYKLVVQHQLVDATTCFLNNLLQKRACGSSCFGIVTFTALIYRNSEAKEEKKEDRNLFAIDDIMEVMDFIYSESSPFTGIKILPAFSSQLSFQETGLDLFSRRLTNQCKYQT